MACVFIKCVFACFPHEAFFACFWLYRFLASACLLNQLGWMHWLWLCLARQQPKCHAAWKISFTKIRRSCSLESLLSRVFDGLKRSFCECSADLQLIKSVFATVLFAPGAWRGAKWCLGYGFSSVPKKLRDQSVLDLSTPSGDKLWIFLRSFNSVFQFVRIIANLAEHSPGISDHAEGLCVLLLCAQQSARIPRVTLLGAGKPAFQMHCSDVGWNDSKHRAKARCRCVLALGPEGQGWKARRRYQRFQGAVCPLDQTLFIGYLLALHLIWIQTMTFGCWKHAVRDN